ncbi:MAG: alpha/beta fold hydrolase [Chloroflexota bacterium]
MPTEKRNIQGTNYAIFRSDTPNNAPTFLALHGFTGRGGDWADVTQRLGNSVRFVAPDLPGHGNTDAPTNPQHYSMPYIASHILQMVDTPCHLLGYSMGGRLALYLATQYPEKFTSLILESASPGLDSADARRDRKTSDDTLAEKIISKGVLWFADYWQDLSLWDSQTIAQKAYLHERRMLNDSVGLANSLRGMGTGVMPSL